MAAAEVRRYLDKCKLLEDRFDALKKQHSALEVLYDDIKDNGSVADLVNTLDLARKLLLAVSRVKKEMAYYSEFLNQDYKSVFRSSEVKRIQQDSSGLSLSAAERVVLSSDDYKVYLHTKAFAKKMYSDTYGVYDGIKELCSAVRMRLWICQVKDLKK